MIQNIPRIMLCCGFVKSHFIYNLQGYFTGTGAIIWLPTGAIIWLPQHQWSNPEGYEHINNINQINDN